MAVPVSRRLQPLAALVVAAGLWSCGSPDGSQQAPAADVIFTNAHVYTVAGGQPWAEAVAVDDGLIVAVGTHDEVARFRGDGTRVVDVGGRLVLPAFGDAHVHPIFGGMAMTRCPLHAGTSLADYQRIVAGCVEAEPGDGPIYGVGWQDALFPPNGIPRKEILDEVSTDRALIFESVGGHSYWLNSKALELGGITKDTPDPENGRIDRDPATGEPVGGLQEGAMDLVQDLIPTPDDTDMQEAIRYVAEHLNSLGITNWHDAGIDLAADGTSATLAAYKALTDRGELTSHVTLAFKWANERSLHQVPAVLEASRRAGEWGLDARTVKFYLDGVIPQWTAAMIEPYEGSDGVRGELQIAPDVLEQAVAELAAAGIQPHVHAIGDRATRVALDAFETALEKNGTSHRPMISHLSVIDPADQQRFGPLGAIAVFQPTWASNYPYMDMAKREIGPVRSRYIYPAGSVLEAGGMLAYGSDWPVATANPLLGLQVAVTRVNYEVPASAPLLPDEGISLAEAVKAHTINVAYATGNADVTGSLEPGKSADLIVLDKDIFSVPATEIGTAKVLLTVFEGQPVFGTLEQFAPGSTEAP